MEQKDVAEKKVPETLWLRDFRKNQLSEMAKPKKNREKKVPALA
jgi:hypothetical protein